MTATISPTSISSAESYSTSSTTSSSSTTSHSALSIEMNPAMEQESNKRISNSCIDSNDSEQASPHVPLHLEASSTHSTAIPTSVCTTHANANMTAQVSDESQLTTHPPSHNQHARKQDQPQQQREPNSENDCFSPLTKSTPQHLQINPLMVSPPPPSTSAATDRNVFSTNDLSDPHLDSSVMHHPIGGNQTVTTDGAVAIPESPAQVQLSTTIPAISNPNNGNQNANHHPSSEIQMSGMHHSNLLPDISNGEEAQSTLLANSSSLEQVQHQQQQVVVQREPPQNPAEMVNSLILEISNANKSQSQQQIQVQVQQVHDPLFGNNMGNAISSTATLKPTTMDNILTTTSKVTARAKTAPSDHHSDHDTESNITEDNAFLECPKQLVIDPLNPTISNMIMSTTSTTSATTKMGNKTKIDVTNVANTVTTTATPATENVVNLVQEEQAVAISTTVVPPTSLPMQAIPTTEDDIRIVAESDNTNGNTIGVTNDVREANSTTSPPQVSHVSANVNATPRKRVEFSPGTNFTPSAKGNEGTNPIVPSNSPVEVPPNLVNSNPTTSDATSGHGNSDGGAASTTASATPTKASLSTPVTTPTQNKNIKSDLRSALDQVLIEAEQAKSPKSSTPIQTTKTNTSTGPSLPDISTPSSITSTDSRPCILQQTLIDYEGGSSTSGTSTPNEDYPQELRGSIHPTGNTSSSTGGGSSSEGGGGGQEPYRIESSMLLPDDSLFEIAQMQIESSSGGNGANGANAGGTNGSGADGATITGKESSQDPTSSSTNENESSTVMPTANVNESTTATATTSAPVQQQQEKFSGPQMATSSMIPKHVGYSNVSSNNNQTLTNANGSPVTASVKLIMEVSSPSPKSKKALISGTAADSFQMLAQLEEQKKEQSLNGADASVNVVSTSGSAVGQVILQSSVGKIGQQQQQQQQVQQSSQSIAYTSGANVNNGTQDVNGAISQQSSVNPSGYTSSVVNNNVNTATTGTPSQQAPQSLPESSLQQQQQQQQQQENESLVRLPLQAMDMLADITCHATPMDISMENTNTQHSEYSTATPPNVPLQHLQQQQQLQQQLNNGQIETMNTQGQTQQPNATWMAPVGQSLSVYSAIAAQAGVATYPPSSTVDNNVANAYQQYMNTATTNTNTALPQAQPQPVPPPQPLTTTPQQQQHQQSTSASPSSSVQSTFFTECYREIGKIRRFSERYGAFGEWEDLPPQTLGGAAPKRWSDINIDESIEIPLRRGGRVRVFPNFIAENRRTNLASAMKDCNLYRQYSAGPDAEDLERRLHVLLHSSVDKDDMDMEVPGIGYSYGGVSMKAQSLSNVPEVERLAQDLGELYRLPENEWNIGVDLVSYQSGEDFMGWHADEKQGEVLILSIVTDSQNGTRPVLIKPKTNAKLPLQEGDEEIIIFVGQGDAYEMDGQMQDFYEHSLPKKRCDYEAKRSVIILRYGKRSNVTSDTGILPGAAYITPNISHTHRHKLFNFPLSFGHPRKDLVEGKKLFSREFLVEAGAHVQGDDTVSGNISMGCSSIIVNCQEPLLREDDGLCWLQITSPKSSGGGALCTSYLKRLPVRVIRSSDLSCQYAPNVRDGRILYRYDGLYYVRAMWDTMGNETEDYPVQDANQHTFFLTRLPKKPLDGKIEQGMYYNKMGLQELWTEIQKQRGVRSKRKFEIPTPLMTLEPIAEGTVRTTRRRSIPAIEPKKKGGRGKGGKRPRGRPKGPAKHNLIPAAKRNKELNETSSEKETTKLSLPRTETPITDSEMDEFDSGSARSRPKRASAAAARSYLQEVIHSRYGTVQYEEEKPMQNTRKRALWPKYNENSNEAKKLKDNHNSDSQDLSSDGEDDLKSITPTKDDPECDSTVMEEDADDKSEVKTNDLSEDKKQSDEIEGQVIVQKTEPSDEKDDSVGNTFDSDSVIKQEKKKSSEKTVDKEENTDIESSENTIKEEEGPAKSTKGEGKSPKSLKAKTEQLEKEEESNNESDTALPDGCRISVNYRKSLFKATVRRSRKKGDNYEYLIHYDGNKKTNVRWIQASMINDSEIQELESNEPKPPRRKAGKSTSPKQAEHIESRKSKRWKRNQKFADRSDVYVDYRQYLYLATVMKTRMKKNDEIEYLVHYDGFKKTSDAWMKESKLHEVNDENTKRFNKDHNKAINTPAKKTNIKHFEGHNDEDDEESSEDEEYVAIEPVRRANTRGASTRSNTPEPLDMGDLRPGIEFLPGSCVFVAKESALYLSKMLRRRKSGKVQEIFVHFEGFDEENDQWVPVSTVYELNPKSKRIYERTASLRSTSDMMTKPSPSKRGVARKKPGRKPKSTKTSTPTKSSSAAAGRFSISQEIDMSGVMSGVDFLPGSTIFAVWKDGLHLGKMMKRRGRGDEMEYLIHVEGNNDFWLPVSMVYEINPQTKRLFNRQKKCG